MNITTNISNNYKKIHQILIVDGLTGEIYEEYNYSDLQWTPFVKIFEGYQKKHEPFDVIEDNIQSKKLFRKYQQNENGRWVKKPY